MPEDTGFFVENISIPVSWYPINESNNMFSYEYYWLTPTGLTFDAIHTVSIPPGIYTTRTLGEAMANVMNATEATPSAFVSIYDDTTKTFSLNSKNMNQHYVEFQLFPDSEVNDAEFKRRSLNKVIGNLVHQGWTQKWTSGYIDMMPHRNLYIHSTGLGNYSTTNLKGERNIIRKVPVTANYGEVIADQNSNGMEYLDCSYQTLSRIGFQLKDHDGNVIDLNGLHWSFSIVFNRVEMGD
jgi:hypothetical protein